MNDLDQLQDWLHEMHGHRMCLTQQKLSNADVREAALAQGEMNALTRVLRVVEKVQNGEERDESERKPHYRTLSKHQLEARRAAADTSDDAPLRGLE